MMAVTGVAISKITIKRYILTVLEFNFRAKLYNTYQIQDYKYSNCGEWCLHVLNELIKGGVKDLDENFIDVILEIINNNK